VLAVARVIGWSADEDTGRSRPGLARIMDATGLALRTVQRWTRWLEKHGLLVVLEEGTTPDYRPGVLSPGDGNLAREWRLSTPALSETGTPPGVDLDLDFERDPGSPSQARTSAQVNPNEDRRSAPDSPSAPPPPKSRPWPPGQKPATRREAAAAAAVLRADLPVLRRMSARAVRSAVREWFAAGWSAADVEHALDHRPDGTRHRHTEDVRCPAAWLAWRLGLWRSEDGAVLPPHSTALAGQAAAHRAALAEGLARLRSVPTERYTEHAARARAMLGRSHA
jgi:hypothetical protein